MRNAEIADALTELATLYELDGAIRYRVLAYREAARVIRQSPVSVEELARAGRATELPGVGKTLEQKILALRRRRRDPVGGEAEAKVPAVAGRGDAGPRSRREDRAPPLRRARRLEPRGPARRRRAGADPRAQGPRAEGRGERPRRARQARRPRARRAAAPLRGPAGGRAAGGRPSRPPGERRGRGRGLGSAANRDLPRHRPDRHRQRARRRWRRRLLDHPLAATKGSSGDGGARITTHNGIAVDLRIVAPDAYGNLLQHFTGSAEHNVELRERAVGWGSRSPSTGSPTPRPARSPATRPRPRSTSASASPTSSPSCARPTARSPRRPTGTLPELVALGGHPRRPALPHDALRRPQHARGDGGGGARPRLRLPRHHRPLGQPRLRQPRHAEAAARSGSRRCGRCNAGRRGFRLLAGSEVNILPDGSLDYDDELLGRARLGDRRASTPRSRSRGER